MEGIFSILFAALIASLPWWGAIALRKKKNLMPENTTKTFGVWMAIALVIALSMFIIDPPYSSRPLAGLGFGLYGIMANFGIFTIAGIIVLLVAAFKPAKIKPDANDISEHLVDDKFI